MNRCHGDSDVPPRYNLRPRRAAGPFMAYGQAARRAAAAAAGGGQHQHNLKANSYYTAHFARGDERNNLSPISSASPIPRPRSQPLQNLSNKQIGKPDVFNNVITPMLLQKGIDISAGTRIGHGRYSKVITAKLINSNHTIAIKIIDKSQVADDFRTKFLPRELEIWQQLKHENLVTLYAIYTYETRVLIVNEYGKMGNLLTYVLCNGATPDAIGVRWAAQMLSGVRYLHEKNIAHRDIKLENIIIFDEKTVKIADFGFSRQLDDNELSKTYCGSKSYIAPEVLSGRPYNPLKSDIWSLGAVFFVMMTNRMPFSENQSNEKVIQAQRERTYHYPHNLSISDQCKHTIDTLMTFDPFRRPSILRTFSLPWIRAHLLSQQ